MKYSNPRTEVTIEDYPIGRGRRGPAHFIIESNNKGERVARTTTGKPKKVTYCQKMRIVDGDDGKTYVIGKAGYNQVIVYPSNIKYPTYYHNSDPEFKQITELLNAA